MRLPWELVLIHCAPQNSPHIKKKITDVCESLNRACSLKKGFTAISAIANKPQNFPIHRRYNRNNPSNDSEAIKGLTNNVAFAPKNLYT